MYYKFSLTFFKVKRLLVYNLQELFKNLSLKGLYFVWTCVFNFSQKASKINWSPWTSEALGEMFKHFTHDPENSPHIDCGPSRGFSLCRRGSEYSHHKEQNSTRFSLNTGPIFNQFLNYSQLWKRKMAKVKFTCVYSSSGPNIFPTIGFRDQYSSQNLLQKNWK